MSPLLADLAAQPQARLDHHGQRHPHDAALFLDADFVGLHLSQVTRLFDQALLDGLAPGARSGPTNRRPSARRSQTPPRWRGTGQPWASKVTTRATVSAAVRSR